MSSAERVGQERGARLGPELGNRLHGEPAVTVRQQVEAGVAVAVGEFLENLRQVGRVLLLQQVQQIGGRPDAQETPDGVEDEVDSALRRHDGWSVRSQTIHCSTALASKRACARGRAYRQYKACGPRCT